MINRMDNICEAVLKGKWPVNRRHVFDFPSNLLPGHGSTAATAAIAMATESPLQRRSLAELTMAGIHTPYSGSEDKTLSPQVHVSFNIHNTLQVHSLKELWPLCLNPVKLLCVPTLLLVQLIIEYLSNSTANCPSSYVRCN